MKYEFLFKEWATLTWLYKGWTLDDIKAMSARERKNWIELGMARYERND